MQKLYRIFVPVTSIHSINDIYLSTSLVAHKRQEDAERSVKIRVMSAASHWIPKLPQFLLPE
jgi:hypothetical protein